MLSTLKLQVSKPALNLDSTHKFATSRRRRRTPHISLPNRRFVSLCLTKPDNASFTTSVTSTSNLTTSVGSPPLSIQFSKWTLSQRHFLILNFIACATAVSATLLFCAAIPTLLAFKRAAESVEKLLDVTREELPGTMAAIRLSGMEISDLTMELSDIGQGITQGVKSSTRVVRVAEESLRRITNRTPSASMQEVVLVGNELEGPVIARTARGIREGIVKGRAMLQMFLTLTKFTRMAFGYFSSRSKS